MQVQAWLRKADGFRKQTVAAWAGQVCLRGRAAGLGAAGLGAGPGISLKEVVLIFVLAGNLFVATTKTCGRLQMLLRERG